MFHVYTSNDGIGNLEMFISANIEKPIRSGSGFPLDQYYYSNTQIVLKQCSANINLLHKTSCYFVLKSDDAH